MKSHATRASESIDAIFNALDRFNVSVQMHPPLLEAIFDFDTHDPHYFALPDNLAILMQFSQKVDWNEAWAALRTLAALPVKTKLSRGPLRVAEGRPLPLPRLCRRRSCDVRSVVRRVLRKVQIG